MKQVSQTQEFKRAVAHLSKSDKRMKKIIAQIGPCRLSPGRPGFDALAKSIIYQQLSLKAAGTIFERVKALTGKRALSAAAIDRVDDESLRKAGLSRGKVRYMRDLAAKVKDKSLPLNRLSKMSDDEVIKALTTVKGIGRWSAGMYLIFVLNRLNVLPIDDKGIEIAIRHAYNIPTDMIDWETFSERWRPYRTIASWYLWRYKGTLKEKSK